MSETEAAVDVAEIERRHVAALESLTPEQQLALAREILGARVLVEGALRDVVATRRVVLDAVFAAEAKAMNAGRTPVLDFFLPLDRELPLGAPREAR